MKNIMRIVLGFLMLTVVVACSADSEETTSLDKIEEAGEIIIGTTGDYQPFTYLDDDNELTGYDIEWGYAIAEKLGVEAVFKTGEFSGLLPGLSQDRFDAVMSSVHVTEERKEAVDFSEPYAIDGAVTVINKGAESIDGPEDVEGLNVGVNAGSNWEAMMQGIGGYSDLKTYPGPTESFSDLLNERVDTVVLGHASAGAYILNSPRGDDLEISGEPLTLGDESNVSVTLKKDSPELKEAIDQAIQELKDDGTYDQLAEKYFGTTFE